MKTFLKIIRTIIGLPFAIIAWLIAAPTFSLYCLPKWVIYGKLSVDTYDDLTDDMWFRVVMLPYIILIGIWGK